MTRTNAIFKRTYFDLAILILRIYLGVVLVEMSSNYLFDSTQMEGLQSFLESMDWPMPKLFAYRSQMIEVIGGAMLVLGFRVAAWLLVGVLMSAVIFAQGFRIFDDGALPMHFAYSSQLIEFIGGAMSILGFRVAAWLLVGVLMSAVIFAHGFRIFEDAALPMHFAIMSWVIALTGCGKYSLDALFFQPKNR